MATQLLFLPQIAFASGVFAPGARARFFLSGTTTPVEVYLDTDYSTAAPSPLVADATGRFPQVFYNGLDSVRCTITSATEASIADIDPVGVAIGSEAASASAAASSASASAAIASAAAASAAALLADTSLTYTVGRAGTVTTGEIVQTRAEGFSYEVAASDATDEHVTTAGGVKLYVLPDESGYNVKAFGVVGDGVTDDTDALEVAIGALAARTLAYNTTSAVGLRTLGNGMFSLNLAGCIIKITRTIALPAMNDVIFEGGVLRGDGTFSTYFGHTYMIATGGFLENVYFKNVRFDCNHETNACYLSTYIRVHFQHCLFYGYTDYGVRTVGGNHELYVTNNTFQQYIFGETGWDVYANVDGIAVGLDNNDNVVESNIILLSNGIDVVYASNQIIGNHIYTLAEGWCVRVARNAENTLMVGNYFDNAPVIIDGTFKGVVLNDNYMLAGTRAPIIFAPKAANEYMDRVSVCGNLFYAPDNALDMISVDTTSGTVEQVGPQCFFRNNITTPGPNGSVALINDTVTVRRYVSGATSASFDLSSLVPIGFVRSAEVEIEGATPVAVCTDGIAGVNSRIVTVRFSSSFTGWVYLKASIKFAEYAVI